VRIKRSFGTGAADSWAQIMALAEGVSGLLFEKLNRLMRIAGYDR
jgi:hypothetical protein